MLEVVTGLLVAVALAFSVRRARRGRVADAELASAIEAGLESLRAEARSELDMAQWSAAADAARLAAETRTGATPELRLLAQNELVGRVDLARKTFRLERGGLSRIPLLAGGAGLAVLAAGGLEFEPMALALPAVLLVSTGISLGVIGAEGRRREKALEQQRRLVHRLGGR